MPFLGAGERARLMPEEFAFKQFLIHGRAVDLDERPLPARRQEVNAAGEQLLARPALANDQQRPVELGGRRRVGERVEEKGGFPDEFWRAARRLHRE